MGKVKDTVKAHPPLHARSRKKEKVIMAKTKTKTKRKSSPTVTRRYLNDKLREIAKKQERIVVEMQAEADKRAAESYKQGFGEGGNDEPPLTWGNYGYRSSKTTFRDESSTSQEAAAERMYRLWATNFVAKPMIEIKAEYVWGDGPLIQGETDEIQKLLDDHWKDSVNKWPEKGLVRIRDLSMYGEWIAEAFVNKRTGRVRWGVIDVIEVEDIITNAENREHIIAIRTKQIALDDGGTTIPPRLLKVIAVDEETGRLVGVREINRAAPRAYEAGEITWRGRPRVNFKVVEKNSPTKEFDSGWSNVRLEETCYGRSWRVSEGHDGNIYNDRIGEEINGIPYDGQCFFFRVNTTSLGMRGRPDLLALIDWLDRLDQLFYDFLEHAALLKDFVWNQTVETSGDKTLKDFQDDFIAAQSQSGKVFTHTQNVTLEPLNPDLKAADFDAMIQPLMERLAGGARLPVHFLGSGGDANLATATAMSSPTHKGFATRQGIVKRMLIEMLQFAIDSAVAAGELDAMVVVKDEKDTKQGDVDAMLDGMIEQDDTVEANTAEAELIPARDAFTVEMPAISEKDTAAAATVFVSVATAVTTLRQMELMDDKIAVTFLAKVAEMLDVDLGIDDWLERLEGLIPRGSGDEGPLFGLLDGDDEEDAAALGKAMSVNGIANGTTAIDKLSAIVNEGAHEDPKGE